MKVKNIYIIGFGAFFSLFLVWYLLIKKSDYCISFKVKTATGTIFQGIQEWSYAQSVNQKETYVVLEKRNFDFIKQEMNSGSNHMEYTWEMKSINDSVTSVNVGIKDFNHSIYNRLTAPFFSTSFKVEQIKKITDFKDGLSNHLKNFKVKIEGEGSSRRNFRGLHKFKKCIAGKGTNNDCK